MKKRTYHCKDYVTEGVIYVIIYEESSIYRQNVRKISIYYGRKFVRLK